MLVLQCASRLQGRGPVAPASSLKRFPSSTSELFDDSLSSNAEHAAVSVWARVFSPCALHSARTISAPSELICKSKRGQDGVSLERVRDLFGAVACELAPLVAPQRECDKPSTFAPPNPWKGIFQFEFWREAPSKQAIVNLHERVSVRASHESPPHGHGVPHVSHSAGGITRPSSGGPAGLSSGTAPVRWGSPVPDAARWGTEAEGLAIAAARRLGRGLRGLAV